MLIHFKGVSNEQCGGFLVGADSVWEFYCEGLHGLLSMNKGYCMHIDIVNHLLHTSDKSHTTFKIMTHSLQL